MFKSRLFRRGAAAKLLGLGFGVVGFHYYPALFPAGDALMRWGVLVWYASLGGVIALVGTVEDLPMGIHPPPALRGAFIGLWFNLLLVLFAHAPLGAIMAGLWGLPGWLTSPWWLLVEGAAVGAVLDLFATLMGGAEKPPAPASQA
jgi:hypothetical protein